MVAPVRALLRVGVLIFLIRLADLSTLNFYRDQRDASFVLRDFALSRLALRHRPLLLRLFLIVAAARRRLAPLVEDGALIVLEIAAARALNLKINLIQWNFTLGFHSGFDHSE